MIVDYKHEYGFMVPPYKHIYRYGSNRPRASICDDVPWELREDREEDEKDREANRLKDELKMKRVTSVVHAVGLVAYIGAALVACSMGWEGWTILMLFTVAMLCMDRIDRN